MMRLDYFPILTGDSPLLLWQKLIKNAEARCSIQLIDDLEYYLIALLMRYVDRPDIAKQAFTEVFLKAMQESRQKRNLSLQTVGDQCLLYTGLFPRAAVRRHVKISYFVDLGRSAYANISHKTDDFYGLLAEQFVAMMDVLQSIREVPDLLPLEAYEQWQDVGSQYAYSVLKKHTHF
ncbi:MAG TPA: hypothetical protein VNC84_07540 [Gammaproteobacteria bacterium]|jgi:hypothetical protein|nr:hypothetical protein [Gammaproteobacteria bacterium]